MLTNGNSSDTCVNKIQQRCLSIMESGYQCIQGVPTDVVMETNVTLRYYFIINAEDGVDEPGPAANME